MSQQFNHQTYLSPFTWRYGSTEMRHIWSEAHKRRLWRQLWIALAEAQREVGLVNQAQVDDLRAHIDEIDVDRAHQIEAEIFHDLMAEVKTFAEQCPIGGGIIHLGATSMDIEDNADALRLRESVDLLLTKLTALLSEVAAQIERWAATPIIGFTHLQPAEPTTLGYRLAQYGFDLLTDLTELRHVRAGIRGKGFKGAVGTSASYEELLAPAPNASPAEPTWSAAQLEARIMTAIDLEPFPVATQTYPRKQDWLVLNALAGLAGSLYKFAFDLRLLQAPSLGEWGEPFGRRQVGSSAMPFKRNPINAENIDSLARFVATLPRVAWDNAAHSLLERTLDDSANRREIFPAAFLATDEIVRRATRLIRDLRIDEAAMARNLDKFGTFAATERVMMTAAKLGADRQEMHEIIREHSMAAWADLAAGRPNSLPARLTADERLTIYLSQEEIVQLLDAGHYVGDAPKRAKSLAKQIKETITSMIKAITFDFWQTLYQGQKVDYAERLRQLKAKVERGQATTFSLEQFQDAVLVARDTWTRTWEEDHRTLSAAEWLDVMLNELGITLATDYLQQIETDMEESVLQNLPILVPGMDEILQELSARYRLGVISDTGLTPGRMLRQIMTEDNIIGYFSHLTFSDELGSSKPHPNNFLATIEALDARPEEAVHIGDLLRTDILGAQAVGMRGIQYVGLQQDDITDLTKDVTPDAVISDHTELFSLLEKWNSATH